MVAVVVENIRKTFGKAPKTVEALKGVSFEIREKEIFGLLGPNGAGKTTLIKVLATLAAASGGRAEVAGVNVANDPAEVRRRIGIVFQEPSLDTLLTARENLALSASLYHLPRAKARERIATLLDVMQLTSRANDLVKTYSGGMKRRLEIARGLLHEPQVLFLDEPTLGLDPAARERLWQYIRQLREQGTTVLLTTHYMEEADALCDRVAIIDHGEIQTLDTPAALKAAIGDTIVYLTAPSHTVESLGKMDGVRTARAREGYQGQFIVTLDGGLQGLTRLFRNVDGIEHFEVRTPTLQDVFLKLTGRDLREDNEEDGGWASDFARMQQSGGKD